MENNPLVPRIVTKYFRAVRVKFDWLLDSSISWLVGWFVDWLVGVAWLVGWFCGQGES